MDQEFLFLIAADSHLNPKKQVYDMKKIGAKARKMHFFSHFILNLSKGIPFLL